MRGSTSDSQQQMSILQEAYAQLVEYISNPVLQCSSQCMAQNVLLAWED